MSFCCCWKAAVSVGEAPLPISNADLAARGSLSLSLSLSLFSSQTTPHTKNTHASSISVTFKDEKDGSVTTVRVPVGMSLLEAAHRHNVDLEGACEGSLACSTCHVVLEDPALYAALPEPDDDENDMLDLAYGLTETSRLGCQVKAAPELEGLTVRIPAATRNFAVDGHIPKPH